MAAKLAGFTPSPLAAREDVPQNVPLTPEKQALKDALSDAFRENLPQLIDALRDLGRVNRLEREADRLDAEADRLKAEGQRGLQEAINEELEIDKRLRKTALENQRKLTEQFFEIFILEGTKPPPTPTNVEDIDALFNQYLTDGSLALEKNDEKKIYPAIKKMTAVISYLKKHPKVKICDLRAFAIDPSTLTTLAEYLKTSTVKVVALKGIPEDARKPLIAAKEEREALFKAKVAASKLTLQFA